MTMTDCLYTHKMIRKALDSANHLERIEILEGLNHDDQLVAFLLAREYLVTRQHEPQAMRMLFDAGTSAAADLLTETLLEKPVPEEYKAFITGQARKLLLEAGDEPSPLAVKIAVAVLNGSVKGDMPSARRLVRRAAEGGSAEALWALSYLPEDSPARRRGYLERACGLGLSKACLALKYV